MAVKHQPQANAPYVLVMTSDCSHQGDSDKSEHQQLVPSLTVDANKVILLTLLHP